MRVQHHGHHDDVHLPEAHIAAKIQLRENLLNHPLRRAGVVERQAAGIRARAEEHQMPGNIGFVPFQNADFRQQRNDTADERRHHGIDFKSKEAAMKTIRDPQQHDQPENGRALFFELRNFAHFVELAFERVDAAGNVRRTVFRLEANDQLRPEIPRQQEQHDDERQIREHPIAVINFFTAQIEDERDGNDVGRAAGEESRGGDVDADEILQQKIFAEAVGFFAGGAVNRGDDEHERQGDDRARGGGGNKRRERELQQHKREQHRHAAVPEADDEIQRDAFGQLRFHEQRAENERHHVQPNDVITQRPQNAAHVPAIEKHQKHHEHERSHMRGNGFGNPQHQSQRKTREHGLAGSRQTRGRGHVVERNKNREADRHAHVTHPQFKARGLLLRNDRELVLLEIEKVVELLVRYGCHLVKGFLIRLELK